MLSSMLFFVDEGFIDLYIYEDFVFNLPHFLQTYFFDFLDQIFTCPCHHFVLVLILITNYVGFYFFSRCHTCCTHILTFHSFVLFLTYVENFILVHRLSVVFEGEGVRRGE